MDPQPATPALTPVSSQERIQALDVVRGFALLGIAFMNVEWFNRSYATMGQGVPADLTGANWWASRFVYLFVQGKFWTLFSLLFGMGFAVMLTRAEQAGRSFLRPYLRRIAALAVFGAAHHILLWNGDILFSYAVGAVALLILLYGKWKPILIALVGLVGLGFVPKLSPVWGVASSLAYVSVAALFLRGEKRMTFMGRELPVFAFVTLVLGTVATLIATVLWALPHGPKEPRIPMTIMSVTILTLGVLAARFHQPLEARPKRLALALYVLPFTMMTTFGLVMWKTQRPAPTTPAQITAEAKRQTERAKRLEEQQQTIRTDIQVHSKGTYKEAVTLRAKHFLSHAPNETGFATVLIAMFLLGTWFVRSGIMQRPGDHLPLFRKLALIALPLGIGLGMVGALFATSRLPGSEQDPYQFASGLLMLGNLPACLGYLGLVVVLLHSRSPLSRIEVLAPVGRMALTNYLLQSLIGAFVFFGHGLGYWGLGRAWQLVYVVVLFALQVGFSHWWLGRFRYGPMEWLWRAITYWQIPPMRLDSGSGSLDLKGAEAPAAS